MANKKRKKLSVLQDKFCVEYAKSGNATEAYKKAGYKVANDQSAQASSSHLLLNPMIQLRLQELAAETHSSKIMDVEEMQTMLTDVARRLATDDFMTMEGSIVERRAAIKDALKAVELLGRMQGAFLDRSKVEMTGAVPVVIGGEENLK